MVEDALACLRLGSDLRQPDGRLGRFHLAEERAHVAELVMPPVLQQSSRLGCDLPLVLGQFAPLVHVLAHFVDDRGRVVLLLGRGQPVTFVEHDVLLRHGSAALLRLRDRRDELRAPPPFDLLLRRLAVRIEFPVFPWIFVGRVEDGVVEERVRHGSVSVGLLGLLRRPLSRSGSGGAGLLRSGDSLRRSHGFERPASADASALRALLFEERENVGWQFLHSEAHLNPVWVAGPAIRHAGPLRACAGSVGRSIAFIETPLTHSVVSLFHVTTVNNGRGKSGPRLQFRRIAITVLLSGVPL